MYVHFGWFTGLGLAIGFGLPFGLCLLRWLITWCKIIYVLYLKPGESKDTDLSAFEIQTLFNGQYYTWHWNFLRIVEEKVPVLATIIHFIATALLQSFHWAFPFIVVLLPVLFVLGVLIDNF